MKNLRKFVSTAIKPVVIALLSGTVLISSLTGCEEEMTQGEIIQIGIASCRTLAPFIRKMDFDPKRSGLSSSETNRKGVALVQFSENPQDTLGKKVWQDSTWTKFGWMGSITTDNKGNAFTAPVPKVSVSETPLSRLNRLYKIDAITGKMQLACILPQADTTQGVVPYAILGVYYDCHGGKLYVSSVAGSTRDNEAGVIYVIDPSDNKIIDQLEGVDAIGVFVGGLTGEKRLFFGRARNSEINSIELTKSGRFKGKPRSEFSLEQLGPRGDDKARRFRLEPNGDMVIIGTEFNFSLVAQDHRIEDGYVFRYDRMQNKWTRLSP